MKSVIIIAALGLLAGCGSMHMQSGSSGSSSYSSSGWGQEPSAQDRIFNSWVGN